MALAWSQAAHAAPVPVRVGPVKAPQAQAPRIVVIDVQPHVLPVPHDKTDLAVELAHAIQTAGCTVPRVCRAADCRAPQKGEEDAHLLSFEGRYDQARFSCFVSIEVRRDPGSGIEYQDRATNPVCPSAQLIKDTRVAGQRACDQLRAASVPVVPTRPPPVAEVAPPPVLAPQIEMPKVATPPPSKWREMAGPALIAVGIGIAIAGGYQALQHGDLTHCDVSNLGEKVCTHTKQRPLAVPLLLLGAGGIGWGVWEITARRDLELLEGLTMVNVGGKF